MPVKHEEFKFSRQSQNTDAYQTQLMYSNKNTTKNSAPQSSQNFKDAKK
jgi:hypothetical protein